MRFQEILREADLSHTDADDRALERIMLRGLERLQPDYVGRLGPVELRRTAYPYGFRFYFFADDQPIGLANVQDRAGDGEYHVSLIWLRPEFRRRGIGVGFYRFLLSQGLKLRPDTDQTSGGKAVWASLRRNP